MKTVKEVSRLSGVSVRTLHHYDAIGLLTPTKVTEAGYRLYDETAMKRLHTILLLRELEFPLQQIREILDNPGFDPVRAVSDQIKLLELKRSRLDKLITHARQIEKTGVIPMDFSAYDHTELDRYSTEAKEKWGNTAAYKEYEQKKSKHNFQASGEAMMSIFARFGAVRTASPESREAQALVKELQDFITANYYTCTRDILAGLGQMYTADERFRRNIDASGGEGTAVFAEKAIEIYCA